MLILALKLVHKRPEGSRIGHEEHQQPVDEDGHIATLVEPPLGRSSVHPAEPPPSELREVEVGQ